MTSISPPILSKKIACIVSNKVDLELISTISSYLNCRLVYYPMFRMPSVEYSKNSMSVQNDDDYMDNVFAQKASTKILNSIARSNCRAIVVIGLSDIQLSYLELEKYYKIKKVYINNIDEVNEKLKFLDHKYDGVLECRKEDIPEGLFIAKTQNMLLRINSKVKSINTLIEIGSKVIVIAEKKNDLTDIIITNYAVSIGADIKFINPVDEKEIDDFNSNLLKWKRENSYGSYLKVAEFMDKALGDLELAKYKFATFFTDGIPYGVFFNRLTCCTHVLRSIKEDLFIFNNLYYESNERRFYNSIVFSPEPEDLGGAVVEEANTVENKLINHKFWVKNLRNEKATVSAFDRNVSYYPYDILHIVSHGGEVTGYYVKQVFFDRNGKKHTVEYEEVIGFALDNSERVQVVSKRLFMYLNGFKWRSEELRNQNYPSFVYKDMFKAISNNEKHDRIERIKVDYLIEKSCHVQCFDNIHQGQFHSIASDSTPLIFNNTCTSWKEFSTQLIAAGCRAYIGTLWSVDNEVALKSAKIFYENLFVTTIASACNEMINEIDSENYKDIYLFCGLHFSTIKKPKEKDRHKILIELMSSLKRWNLYISRPKEKSLIINAINVVKFICFELAPFYMSEGVTELIVKSLMHCNHIENLINSDDFE